MSAATFLEDKDRYLQNFHHLTNVTAMRLNSYGQNYTADDIAHEIEYLFDPMQFAKHIAHEGSVLMHEACGDGSSACGGAAGPIIRTRYHGRVRAREGVRARAGGAAVTCQAPPFVSDAPSPPLRTCGTFCGVRAGDPRGA